MRRIFGETQKTTIEALLRVMPQQIRGPTSRLAQRRWISANFILSDSDHLVGIFSRRQLRQNLEGHVLFWKIMTRALNGGLEMLILLSGLLPNPQLETSVLSIWDLNGYADINTGGRALNNENQTNILNC
ncbi:MATE efflux family protein [Perilla frutescens var. frutescens]|nr:MATE efflux family protein [Perilla frutescens var. frutescens]